MAVIERYIEQKVTPIEPADRLDLLRGGRVIDQLPGAELPAIDIAVLLQCIEIARIGGDHPRAGAIIHLVPTAEVLHPDVAVVLAHICEHDFLAVVGVVRAAERVAERRPHTKIPSFRQRLMGSW